MECMRERGGAPVLQQHEAALEGAPPQLLLDTDLDGRGVDRQGEQDHARGNGPVVVVDPPGPDAAPIHLHYHAALHSHCCHCAATDNECVCQSAGTDACLLRGSMGLAEVAAQQHKPLASLCVPVMHR